jgi:hypothetical protein
MESKNKIDVNLILKIGVGLAAYFFVLKPILEKTGIVKSTEEKENEQSEITQEGWSPLFWKKAAAEKKYVKADTINPTILTAYATKIYNSFGTFNDDETAIYSVFKQINTQVNLSLLVWAYAALYKADLFKELQTKLSDEELNTIVKYVNSYKKYK